MTLVDTIFERMITLMILHQPVVEVVGSQIFGVGVFNFIVGRRQHFVVEFFPLLMVVRQQVVQLRQMIILSILFIFVIFEVRLWLLNDFIVGYILLMYHLALLLIYSCFSYVVL